MSALRVRYLLVASVLAGLLLAAVLSSAGARNAATAAKGHRSRSRIVATVASVHGRNLYLKRAGKLSRLRAKEKILLRDLIVAGPASSAVIHFTFAKHRFKPTVDVLDIYKQFKQRKPKAKNVSPEVEILAGYSSTHRKLTIVRSGKLIDITIGR